MDDLRQRPPLFTIHWLCDVPPNKPEKMQSDGDILAALHNVAADRGDRSYHAPTGIWTWRGSGWRLRDTSYFIVDVDGEQPERAVEWLQQRGYPDEEDPYGYVHVFNMDNGEQHVLSSILPMGKLNRLVIWDTQWLLAEKWVLNLGKVVSFHSIYGRFSVIHANWSKPDVGTAS